MTTAERVLSINCMNAAELDGPDAIINLVHDLRQPLSAIETIAYYLNMRATEEQAEVRDYLAKIQELVAEVNVRLTEALVHN